MKYTLLTSQRSGRAELHRQMIRLVARDIAIDDKLHYLASTNDRDVEPPKTGITLERAQVLAQIADQYYVERSLDENQP